MCSDLGEGSRCCAGYSFVGALFTVSQLERIYSLRLLLRNLVAGFWNPMNYSMTLRMRRESSV